MRYGQMVMGPAGCGKSTYCAALANHAAAEGRTINVVNLDFAAEYFDYTPMADVRDLVSVDDAMEDESMRFGPNGGLIFCMEFLLENADWLQVALGDTDEDSVLFDCPGQIELYTHMPVMRQLCEILTLRFNFRLCAIFIVDAQFMVDGAKFLSGSMAALSVMANLEIPHLNIVSKMDLLNKAAKSQIESYLDPDPHILLSELSSSDSKWNQRHYRLSEALGKLLQDYSLVRFYPLNITDHENISDILMLVDGTVQCSEEADIRTRDFEERDPEDDDPDPVNDNIRD